MVIEIGRGRWSDLHPTLAGLRRKYHNHAPPKVLLCENRTLKNADPDPVKLQFHSPRPDHPTTRRFDASKIHA